jgi:tetratricopeptide (TPR) repeat protein
MASTKKNDLEDLDFQMGFYEGVLQERPAYVEVLIALGEIYTRKGFYEKGLAVDRKLSELRPENPIVHYNLACSLSLVGDIASSFKAIKRAIRLGYSDFQYLTQDPDLMNLRRDQRFSKLLQELRKLSTSPKNAAKKGR